VGEEVDADLNQALRERLVDFLQRYEAQKAEGPWQIFRFLLRARDVLAASVPVRRYFQAKFDRILVDEFQDTDPLQAELVAFLAEDPSLLQLPTGGSSSSFPASSSSSATRSSPSFGFGALIFRCTTPSRRWSSAAAASCCPSPRTSVPCRR